MLLSICWAVYCDGFFEEAGVGAAIAAFLILTGGSVGVGVGVGVAVGVGVGVNNGVETAGLFKLVSAIASRLVIRVPSTCFEAF